MVTTPKTSIPVLDSVLNISIGNIRAKELCRAASLALVSDIGNALPAVQTAFDKIAELPNLVTELGNDSEITAVGIQHIHLTCHRVEMGYALEKVNNVLDSLSGTNSLSLGSCVCMIEEAGDILSDMHQAMTCQAKTAGLALPFNGGGGR
jgi:hypothetical protein